MKTKGTIAFTALLLACIMMIGGCDAGLEYVKLDITTYPDKIFYVKDVDTGILVKGLTLTLTTKDGHKEVLTEPKNYTTNVDFSKEGIYTVTYTITDGVSASFPVQVVSRENLMQYLK